jgi:hypothetical protein
MDLWLAQQCDLMLSHEVDSYNAIRPIAYTNWPTLDPLTHPTEATTKEEGQWRRRSGRRAETSRLEYENDAIALDANLIEPTAANPAGWFAAYHAYPYYPDFIMLDPRYRAARSPEGPSNYFGYLQELVRHHQGMPTLIAEYGVPSSRGIAHLQPQGWHHGGHDDRGMAGIDARLTREIHAAGAAGGVIFAWLDEWFKKNWIVIDYEIPADNTRRWHNVMDAEQNYGIIAMPAGDAFSRPRLGGDPRLWRALQAVQLSADLSADGPRSMRMGSDESYYYIAVDLPPGRFRWHSMGIRIALDTYLPRTGQHRLPGTTFRSEIGFEFLVDLQSPETAYVSVVPEYNRHSRIDSATGDDRGAFSRRPVVTRDRNDARFEQLHVITNRARFGRDGTFFPAEGYDRGRMRFGTEAQSTNSDWYFDSSTGLLQIRIPWDLLNVTDPSTRTLLFDKRTSGNFGTVVAEDWHGGILVYTKGAATKVRGALPEIIEGVWRQHAFTGWRLLRERQLDPCRELLEAERLDHVVHGAASQAAEYVPLVTLGSHHDHRNCAHDFIGLQAAQYLEPAQYRHHRVEHDEVRRITQRQLQCLFPVGGTDDLMTTVGKLERDHVPDLLFVLRQQYPRHGYTLLAAGVVGRVTMKRVPLPT